MDAHGTSSIVSVFCVRSARDEMEHEEVCTICADPIATDETDRPRVTIECGHVFPRRVHRAVVRAGCTVVSQLPWTRSHALRVAAPAAQRVAAMRRRKTVPAALRRLVARWDASCERLRAAETTRREHDHANRDALRRHKQLRSAAHCARRRHSWELRRAIETMCIPGVPLAREVAVDTSMWDEYTVV